MPVAPRSPHPLGVQGTLDELGTPLSGVTFVVVDLETTGSSAADSRITEIGAVKTRGGELLGEFQTLVDPGEPIPAFISVLTGITNAMVEQAPPIEAVLPSFLEFARGAVLVAHNAPFDISFLTAATARMGLEWPRFDVIDTVRLARQLVPRDEVPNHKLGTLAAHFGAEQTPDHRALHDARATMDVLHALIGRVGNLGVHTLEELRTYSSRVSAAQRRQRHLAEDLPEAPGVYLFKDANGRVLYVGTSTDIRRRVRTYFTASEQRTRMAEMVASAHSVTPVVCATPLEAQVRELRLIAEHEPRYNRRSRRPATRPWVKLTAEPFPRLSVVRQVRDDQASYIGPFPNAQAAADAIDALHEALPLRQCTTRLSGTRASPACALAQIGRCSAPCRLGTGADAYAEVAAAAHTALEGDARTLIAALTSRLGHLAREERFEQAAALRDRTRRLLQATARAQRLRALGAVGHLVAARRRPGGGWEIVCVRHGRLAGTCTSPPGADPVPFADALVASSEVVPAPVGPTTSAFPDEADLVLSWLDDPHVRLVSLEGTWAQPVHGAGHAGALLRPPPSDPSPARRGQGSRVGS